MKWNRRELLKDGSLLALGGFLHGGQHAAAEERSAEATGAGIYASLGVRTIVNCKGTFTIIGGSLILPEVKRAMDEASRHYVHIDELMNAVGKRLADLSGAEWGIVTAGCAAAMTNATAGCIAGNDPEKMIRLPDLRGLKSEVIIPKHSRNPYDHAVRMLGVKIIEVNTLLAFERALNSNSAMVYIMSSPEAASGPMGIQSLCAAANARGVPVFVDAAAENPVFPNPHLKNGASMVGYSGGKCLRGPQCAGLLFGKKELIQAAWANSAPHHVFGRSLKVGKEEIVGALTAFEMWSKRDHEAEWRTWMAWLGTIRASVERIAGVTTQVIQPVDLSNHAPQLRICWDGAVAGITGSEVLETLGRGEPRILLAEATGKRPDAMTSAVSVMPSMMQPGDAEVVASALYKLMSRPPVFSVPAVSASGPRNVTGVWEILIDYIGVEARHFLLIEQHGMELSGRHEGEAFSGPMNGEIYAGDLKMTCVQPIEGTVIEYVFEGETDGEEMIGTVHLGEYGSSPWKGKRLR